MLDQLFSGLFESGSSAGISISDFLLCMLISLLVGALLAAIYTYKSKYTRSFVITLALLPSVVSVVIMLVNGNIGAGIAVAGAFSLVRFRSVPGTAKEIYAIFLAMAAGLAVGMGYPGFSVLFTVIVGLASMLYARLGLGTTEDGKSGKELRITIPEDLDYDGVFDDLLSEYAGNWQLVSVRTTNMGSLYRLRYTLSLKEGKSEKEFIDKLRCRNGNLEVSLSLAQTAETVEL